MTSDIPFVKKHKTQSTTVAERVSAANEGENPYVICRLKSGWVIAFDDQPVHGYCLLMSDPIVPTLNALNEEERARYLLDMARIGDAILHVTGAARINYETWCNKDQSLHTHIVPRFSDEAPDKRYLPVCKAYDGATSRKFDPESSEDRKFLAAMRTFLKRFSVDV